MLNFGSVTTVEDLIRLAKFLERSCSLDTPIVVWGAYASDGEILDCSIDEITKVCNVGCKHTSKVVNLNTNIFTG